MARRQANIRRRPDAKSDTNNAGRTAGRVGLESTYPDRLLGARYHIDLSPAEPILAALGKSGAADDDMAGGFRQLGAVMRATLGELSLAFARGKSVVRVRVWLFGRSDDGTLVGLRSLSTET